MPSASPIASAKDLVESLLDVASQVILPDWRALVDLFPIFLLILLIAWFAFTSRKFATLGPRRRAPWHHLSGWARRSLQGTAAQTSLRW